MTTDQTAPPGPRQAIASHTAASTPAADFTAHGGWTLQRLEVINDAAGSLCPLRDDGR
jgi:hypothetical protein